MEIKILEKTSNKLKIEIAGEGHTLCNALQKALLDDDTIQMAGYDVPHPLVAGSIIYVYTKGRRKPDAALRGAAKKVESQSKEFRKVFKKALKYCQRKGRNSRKAIRFHLRLHQVVLQPQAH